MKDGEEITGQFFKENDWNTDYDSLLTGKPTEENVRALKIEFIFNYLKGN